MKTIYKYSIGVTDMQTVEMPEGAEILTVQVQHGTPCLWAIVDPQRSQTKKRSIKMFGTGQPVNYEFHGCKYIGTVQMNGGQLVWHYFESIAD
jgi:hypothetical protein